MERHLRHARKRVLLIGILTHTLFFGGCGGGGGGGDLKQVGFTEQAVSSASLSWRTPSQRTDGESLSMSEMASYRIYYGKRSGEYDSVLTIRDPYTTAVVIDDLPAGTFYFAITAVDVNGLESAHSREVVKRVQS